MGNYKTVNIDAELHKELKKKAIEMGISLTDLVKDIIVKRLPVEFIADEQGVLDVSQPAVPVDTDQIYGKSNFDGVKLHTLVPGEEEIDYDPEVDEIHPCEGYGCKSTKTEAVTGEGVDDEGNLKSFTKYLCEFHRKKVK